MPPVLLADAAGTERRRVVGFGRQDWQALFTALSQQTGITAPVVDWDAYPDSRPGCGSRSVDPDLLPALRARFESQHLAARRVELADAEDEYEAMFARGWSDGLPLVPPTPERVLAMLEGTKRAPDGVVAIVPPDLAPCTVEKVAINAVLAGC